MEKPQQIITLKVRCEEVPIRLRKFCFQFQNENYIKKYFVIDDFASWMRRFFERVSF